MQSIKEHNLKANHNKKALRTIQKVLYAIYQRTQSESKSQPVSVWNYFLIICMQSIKEHNLKANHPPAGGQSIKEHNLKVNHLPAGGRNRSG